MDYRRDIQVLRGVAVLQVVLFHLGVPGFGSGYLGVDVFLVVSGYLMAVMYRPQATRSFFEKRAKRLLPAYFVTVLATLVAAALLSAPQFFEQVFDQVFFAALLSSNIGFWLQDSYFAKESFRPLLHLWSLGIELQFYLLVPLLYWASHRSRALFISIALVSALACLAMAPRSPESAFFLLPFRLWEFLVGFGLAEAITRNQETPGSNRWAWAGVPALVVLALVPSLPLDAEAGGFLRGHPGGVTLVVVLATAAVLYFRLPPRLLATAPSELLESTGRYSYSIYLAHFPVIVLALHRPSMDAPVQQLGIMVALVVTCSALLYAAVERPFRARPSALAVIAILGAASLLASQGDRLLRRNLDGPELLIAQARVDRGQFRCGKRFEMFSAHEVSCEITPPIESPSGRMLLVGDSHADAIKSILAELAAARGIAVYLPAENDALIGNGMTPEGVLAEARKRQAALVLLHYSARFVGAEPLDRLAALAREQGVRLALLLPVPAWSESIPDAMRDALDTGRTLPCMSVRDYEDRNRPLLDWLSRPGHEDLAVYPVTDAFLQDGCFQYAAAGRPLYYDESHLTLSGSRILQNVLERLLDDFQRSAASTDP